MLGVAESKLRVKFLLHVIGHQVLDVIKQSMSDYLILGGEYKILVHMYLCKEPVSVLIIVGKNIQY